MAGRYAIEELLGYGGMGSVYLAKHLQLNYPVALKVLRLPAGRVTPTDRERFRQEARIAVSLDHPNVVRVFDYGSNGIDYLVMELIDGSNAHRLLREGGPFPLSNLIQVGEDILGGLDCLHGRGIIHRDIKPANILIRRQDTRVKLADFGLALNLDAAQDFVGTPMYMAPEVLGGTEASPASDVFSLGVSLLELLTGKIPWSGGSLGELRRSMEAALPGLPSLVHAHAPPGVATFLTTCMDAERNRRFRDAAEAAKALACSDEVQSRGEAAKVPLFRNRVAVVTTERLLGEVLSAALGASGLLSVVSLNGLAGHELPGLLGRLDAVLLDPCCGPPKVVEEFVGVTRSTYPHVVFFLLMPRIREDEILSRFSLTWQERFGHYFALYTDRPVTQLPDMIGVVAKGILFDRSAGGRSRHTSASS